MFYLLEKFIMIENAVNVEKIYKSITFSLIENFDDFNMRELISINLKMTISKMGLNVNILAEPLLLHYKQLKVHSFNFSSADYQLLEYIMLTIEFDPETFRN